MSALPALALALTLPLAALAPGPGDAQEVFYVDASLELDGGLLSWRFVDLDGDGARELVLAVRTRAGERELRVYRVGTDQIGPEPTQTIPVLGDVLAWGAADVRDEPGRELLFLTRGGAWSYSPTLPGYRGNVRPLVTTELIYDIPDPRALPYWAYVVPGRVHDVILLPGREGFGLWGPSEGDPSTYVELAHVDTAADEDETALGAIRSGGLVAGVRVAVDSSSPFLPGDLETEATLLSASRRTRAPALVDVDGDGLLDMVVRRENSLALHAGLPDGPANEPTRVEPLPQALLGEEDEPAEILLRDVDGDGDLDVVAHVQGEIEGFENTVHRVLVYTSDGLALLSAEPIQVLRFEAAVLRMEVADVDGDGRPDLALRKLELPSLLEAVTGLEFTFSHLVYLGERRGFEKRPSLKHVETYDEESVAQIVANRRLVLDCDGDGVADLVEVDLQGRIAIRRLRRKSSLLRGDSWRLEPAPWKRFDASASLISLSVRDLNGDGLGDVVSAGPERLTVLLSQRRGGGR